MSYHDRCNALNKNLTLVVRNFQYRVELFFKTIILNGSLGETNYDAIPLEFQVRGRSHVHSLTQILNSPKLTNSNKEGCKVVLIALNVLTYQTLKNLSQI